MRVKIFNIQYDGTVDEICTAKLPRRMTIEVVENFDLENDLSELVSNRTGWCILGCSYKVI